MARYLGSRWAQPVVVGACLMLCLRSLMFAGEEGAQGGCKLGSPSVSAARLLHASLPAGPSHTLSMRLSADCLPLSSLELCGAVWVYRIAYDQQTVPELIVSCFAHHTWLHKM